MVKRFSLVALSVLLSTPLFLQSTSIDNKSQNESVHTINHMVNEISEKFHLLTPDQKSKAMHSLGALITEHGTTLNCDIGKLALISLFNSLSPDSRDLTPDKKDAYSIDQLLNVLEKRCILGNDGKDVLVMACVILFGVLKIIAVGMVWELTGTLPPLT